jgi:hypothetical protein
MTTAQRMLCAGGALLVVAALVRCDNGSPGGTDDMAPPADMATPGPTLTLVSPTTAVNTGGALITLTGTNFKAGATVTIGGTACGNVTVVSATQITCTVPAKAATCGPATVVVTNPDSFMVSSDSLFRYAPKSQAWDSLKTIAVGPTGTTIRQAIAADLDGDGILDIITANSGSGNLAVLKGTGGGNYGSPSSVDLGGMSPYAVAVAYLNNDKILDLVAVRNVGNDVKVRLGVGNGTFTTPATDSFAVGMNARDIAIGDLDGDGRSDALVVNFFSQTVSVLLSNGDGTFKPATSLATLGARPSAITIGRFNSDNLLDWATADTNADSVTVKLASGPGTFPAQSINVTGVTAPSDLVAADFNNDGILDLAIANSGVGTVRLTIGVGDGSFDNSRGMTRPVGTTNITARSIAAADFNVDGKMDLAVTNNADGNVSILLGNGDGTLQTKVDQATGADPTFIHIADLDKNGLPDLLTTDQGNNNVHVRLNLCN